MRQSELFTKTRKEVPADETSKNAQLLIRAGFIHKELAGVYAFLPLGKHVIDNISKTADFVIVSGLIAKEIAEKNIKFQYPEKIIAPAGQLAVLDIDEESIKIFQKKILSAKTIVWNGPFGKFEDNKYGKGTLALAIAIIESRAFSVVGGGETVEFLAKQGMIEKFSWISTGGGAMLAYLAGDRLPGLDALN